MFMTKLTIGHSTDTEWASRYITEPASRLTNLVQTIDPTLLAKEFSEQFNVLHSNKKLLFRSKSTNFGSNEVQIINFFDSAETYLEFSRVARSEEVYAAYTKLSLVYNMIFTDNIDPEAEIDSILASNVDALLIQYCDSSLYRDSMGVVGDPLK